MKYKLWLPFLLLLVLGVLGCSEAGPYEETFDVAGPWPEEDNPAAAGVVQGGGYELEVKADSGIFWATGGETFADGVYELEATQIAGTVDNGYGMMFMVDIDAGDFYAFQVSGDGFVWIGRCEGECQQDMSLLVGEGWEESAAVNTGLNNTNVLRVEVEEGSMIFSVNGQEVGRTFDVTLSQGEIGLVVETLGEGGVKVRFDNLTYTPSEG